MNDKMSLVLTELAERLEVAASSLWLALIRQAFIESMITLIGLIVGAFGIGIWYKIIQKRTKRPEPTQDCPFPQPLWNEDERAAVYVFFYCFIFVWSIFFLANAHTLSAGFFNPEYWALQKVLK